jgi:hypothetical protein
VHIVSLRQKSDFLRLKESKKKFFISREDLGHHSYFLTMANLVHNETTLLHPGLESYSLVGPSFLVAETVVYNFELLKEMALHIPMESASAVFSHMLTSEMTKGRYIPEITCKVNVGYRFSLPISINHPHQIIRLGEIRGLSYSPIPYGSKTAFIIKVKKNLSEWLPSPIKDFIRPLWLRIQR